MGGSCGQGEVGLRGGVAVNMEKKDSDSVKCRKFPDKMRSC